MGRGFGINAMIGSATGALGPSVASAVLAVAPWAYLFALNVPFGIAGVWLGLRMLPDSPRAGHRFDGGSAVLSAMAFGGLILGITETLTGYYLSTGYKDVPGLVLLLLVLSLKPSGLFGSATIKKV